MGLAGDDSMMWERDRVAPVRPSVRVPSMRACSVKNRFYRYPSDRTAIRVLVRATGTITGATV